MTRLAQVTCALYVPRAELEAWFDRARAGERHVYARGPSLDAKHDVPTMIREWIATGEATCSQGRDPATRDLLYYVTRCRPQQADGARRRVRIDEEWRETTEGKIFLALVRAANMGAACPSNADLAEVAGLPDADAARYVLYEKLVKGGRVEVIGSGGARGGRVIRISETGKVTAESSGPKRVRA